MTHPLAAPRSPTSSPDPRDIDQLSPGSLALMGIAWDCNSSFVRGAARAPGHIREALRSDAGNSCALRHLRADGRRQSGLDLRHEDQWVDLGDLEPAPGAQGISTILDTARAILQRDAHILSLGGDHAISYPLLRAHAEHGLEFDILHFDAHPDLYDDFEGNPYSHASPFARFMEHARAQGTRHRLIQLGIRTMNPHQQDQAGKFGVEVHELPESIGLTVAKLELERPIYLTLDLDAFDPAYAPGVAHHEPGGLSSREVFEILCALPVPIIGADIVELNPARDVGGVTATLAAKLCKQVASQMLGFARV